MEGPVSLKQLHPEIWSRIIRFLHRPRYVPGSPISRKDIRQHDLSTMMRVSKTMYDLTSSILYTHIVTDDLIRLILGHDSPSTIPGIKSKNELLSYTSRLFLEYPEGSPTYQTIMQSGDKNTWNDMGLSGGALSALEIPKYIKRSSAALPIESGTLTDIFTSLHTLSLGTYFGGPGLEWAEKWLADAGRFEADLPMQRFMMRTITGPLSVPRLNSAPEESDPSTFAAPAPVSCCKGARLTFHITSRSKLPWYCWSFPVVLGAKTRWCFDDSLFDGTNRDQMPRSELESQYQPIMQQSGTSVLNQIISRERYLLSHPESKRTDHQMDLDIYAPVYNPSDTRVTAARLKEEPTAADLNADQIRTAAERFDQLNMGKFYWKYCLADIRRNGVKHEGIEKEGYTMFRISDCPPCPACDWEPPRARLDNPWYEEDMGISE